MPPIFEKIFFPLAKALAFSANRKNSIAIEVLRNSCRTALEHLPSFNQVAEIQLCLCPIGGVGGVAQ